MRRSTTKRPSGATHVVPLKVGTQYFVVPDVMLYATYGTGYKGPALQTSLAFVGQSAVIRPETVWDVEAGVKSFLFDHKVRLNVSGFVEHFTNFQTQSFAQVEGNPTPVSVNGNAGGVQAGGAEIAATWKVTPALTLNYNVTLEDSYFTDYAADPCYATQTSNGCTTSPFFQGKGLATSTAAHYSGTFDATYTWDLPHGQVSLDGNWYHRSSINFLDDASPYTRVGAINVFGANLTYNDNAGWSVSVFCKNCSNEIYPNHITLDPLDAGVGKASTFNRFGYNSVRTVGGLVSYKF